MHLRIEASEADPTKQRSNGEYSEQKSNAATVQAHKHECPICRETFDEFVPVTKNHPRKARCPGCGSVERHRFFWLLQDMGGILPQGGRFLHFAPERWLVKPMSERYGLGYLCADYELPPYDVKLDVQSMPFRDELFRGILCFSVLEHIPDDHKAMREMARVLEPGGVAVIHVPLQYQTHASWREKLDFKGRKEKYGQGNHWRYYGLDIVDTLKENGFASTEMLRPSDKLSKDEIDRHGLVNTSRLIIARKAAA